MADANNFDVKERSVNPYANRQKIEFIYALKQGRPISPIIRPTPGNVSRVALEKLRNV